MTDDASTLQQLISRARRGDEAAAETLVRQYEAEIRTEVRMRMRNQQLRRVFDSSDVCQEVLASFFVRLRLGQYKLDEPRDLVRLLVRIARNKAIQRHRYHRAACRNSGGREALSASLLPSREAEPAGAVALNELVECIYRRLDATQSRIADLRRHGQTWQAIAQRLGQSAEAVRKQYERAIARVEAELEREPF